MLATLGTLRVKLTLAWYKKNSSYSIGDQHRRQRNVPCIQAGTAQREGLGGL